MMVLSGRKGLYQYKSGSVSEGEQAEGVFFGKCRSAGLLPD
jgi:hypothetical protein